MSKISAALVKELRTRTGVGMMECKKALLKADGDIDKAIEALRTSGLAKAAKKAGREAAEGVIAIAKNSSNSELVMVEINSETDFVAREERFSNFANDIAHLALESKIDDVENLKAATMKSGETVENTRLELVNQLGENISVRRVHYYSNASGSISTYNHKVGGITRIGAYVALDVTNDDLARDLAMQVAAMKPEFIGKDDVPQSRIDAEKKILEEQTKQQNKDKPQDILDKILLGKISKFVNSIILEGQQFVKDDSKKIATCLKEAKAKVIAMQRFEVGEGIEKKEEDFVAAVMSEINKR